MVWVGFLSQAASFLTVVASSRFYNDSYILYYPYIDNSYNDSYIDDGYTDSDYTHIDYNATDENCRELIGAAWSLNGCVLVNGIYYSGYKTKLCNGEYMLLTEPCNGECSEYWYSVGGKCSEFDVQICNGEYILSSELCNGKCPESLINIRGSCVDETFTRLCRNISILETDICDGKCFEPYFVYFNGECVNAYDVRLCNGELALSSELCFGCEKNFVNVSGKCVPESLTWVCQGVNLRLETACNNTCTIGRFLANGTCTDNFWKCGKDFQSTEKPCDRHCFSDSLCLKDGKCLRIEDAEKWSCDKSCDNFQPTSEPCGGHCPNSKERYPSTFLRFSDSHGYAYIGGRCQKGDICHVPSTFLETYEGSWECYISCIGGHEPCWGHCQEGAVLLGGRCVLADETYKCGVETQRVEDSCDGRCFGGRVNIDGRCIANTWECEGIIRPAEDPCLGKCPATTNKKFIDYQFDSLEYLTDFVSCGSQCLLRSEAWDCYGTCQAHSEPCRGRCLDGECVARNSNLEVWKYFLIDGKCERVKDDPGCNPDTEFPVYVAPITKQTILNAKTLGP